MRPVHLAVEGLACFRDRQEIDFRPLELFAISGPTGAGKSTLLDAIIFALYGEIPRVNLQSRTEMIAAARDRATVVLEFDAGASRYRIARTLRRNGLQMVRLEERDESGVYQSVADHVRTVTERMARILGLEAAAFLQAVVLPQGEFARFLKAPPRDRRSMLRTLLRLDVYERMREQAQRLALVERTNVESLRKLLTDEYAGLDEAGVARLEVELVRIRRLLAASRERRDRAQAALARTRGLHAKTQELRQIEGRRAALEEEAEQVGRERARLAAAARAAPLVPLLDEAARAWGAARSTAQAAKEAQARHHEAQRDWRAKARALAASERAARVVASLRTRVSRLHRVAGRLPERERLEETVETQAQSLAALAGERSALAERLAAARDARTRQKAAAVAARQAARASGYDHDLDELLQGERDRASLLGAVRRMAVEHTAELAGRRRAAREHEREIERLRKRAAAAGRAAAKTQRAIEAAEDALHRAVGLNEVNRLRGELAPGEPCPVCEQIVSAPPAVTPAPEVEAARAALQEARARRADAEAQARRSDAALAGEEAKLLAARQGLVELEARCAELRDGVAEAQAAIVQALGDRAPQGGGAIERWIERRIAALARSRKAHAEALARQAAAERAMDEARHAEAAARERLAERSALQKRLAGERGNCLRRLKTLAAEIRAVTRAADPAAEAASLEEKIRQLEGGVKSAAEEAARAQSRLAAAAEVHRLSAESALAALEDTHQRMETRDAEIERAGFADEAAVRNALLDAAATRRLEELVQRHLQDTHTVEDRAAALRAELGAARVSDQQLLAAEKRAADLTASADDAVGREKRLEEQIGRARERLERSQELREKLERDVAALHVHELLAGDLRNDRFQAYLLQEVFTELVRGASGRLLTLTTERYSLRFRDDEIRVVDHDNADESRISDTLSGGETFLTSLALALELSDQVQRTVGAVHLDSLFIDEGFGTLDPDTLALVSETLQNLRVGGRMVGIITHIPELRDEFEQQILVVKHQGYSTVEVHGTMEKA